MAAAPLAAASALHAGLVTMVVANPARQRCLAGIAELLAYFALAHSAAVEHIDRSLDFLFREPASHGASLQSRTPAGVQVFVRTPVD